MSPAVGTHDVGKERATDLQYAARRAILVGRQYADEEITRKDFLAELARLQELIDAEE